MQWAAIAVFSGLMYFKWANSSLNQVLSVLLRIVYPVYFCFICHSNIAHNTNITFWYLRPIIPIAKLFYTFNLKYLW